MKDTTKIGIYFLIGVIMLVVPITYTLTTMANNLKNIDTNQIVISVDKLIQNLGKGNLKVNVSLNELIENTDCCFICYVLFGYFWSWYRVSPCYSVRPPPRHLRFCVS